MSHGFQIFYPQLPVPLVAWAKKLGLPPHEWRKPGIADYCPVTDTWQVGEVTLKCVTETEEERYYCGLYEGPMERQPVMYYVIMPLAMLPPPRQKPTENQDRAAR